MVSWRKKGNCVTGLLVLRKKKSYAKVAIDKWTENAQNAETFVIFFRNIQKREIAIRDCLFFLKSMLKK